MRFWYNQPRSTQKGPDPLEYLDERAKQASFFYLEIARKIFVSVCLTVMVTKHLDRFHRNFITQRFFGPKSGRKSSRLVGKIA